MLITFKKYLISVRAQSIIEYTVIFVAFAVAMGIFITRSRQAFDTHFQEARTEILR